MAFVDRVTASVVDGIPSDALPGRYVAGGSTQIGAIAAERGDHLVADANGRWTAKVEGGASANGRFSASERLRAEEQATLLGIVRELEADDERVRWSALLATVPLVRPAPDRLEPTPVDRALETNGPHLLEVCRRPYAKLDTLVERTLASRASRFPPRAIQHLAEHSEDWQQRTVQAVIPRQLLAQRFEERLDVYENRVVARLVDRLIPYLRARHEELQQLRDLFRDVADFSSELRGNHWLTARLSALWGGTFEMGDELDRVELLERQLAERLRRVGGLKDTALYETVPRNALVGARLRPTNVLVEHQHYRRVAALWRELDEHAPSARDQLEHYRAAQAASRSFDTYCLLLVAQALARFGFEPSGDPALDLKRGGELELRGARGGVRMRWDPPFGIVILVDDAQAIRFVPLGAHLAARVSPVLRDLRAGASAARTTVVLYPGLRHERDDAAPESALLLNPPDTGIHEQADCAALPVSPLDIFSLERVERVVRRRLLGDLLRSFPPVAACRRNVRDKVAALVSWLDPHPSDDGLFVLKPPSPQALGRLKAALREATKGLRPRQDDALRRAFEAVPAAVEATSGYYAAISECPICTGLGAFRSLGSHHFELSCTSCGSAWGLHACGECGGRIPFLALGDEQPAEPWDDRGALTGERLDREHGRDVLAIPLEQPGGEHSFACPACARDMAAAATAAAARAA